MTMDAAGRVVIPKPVRQRLGLAGGEPLNVRERDGRIEIEPAATPMKLVGRKPLTDAIVRDTIERSRR